MTGAPADLGPVLAGFPRERTWLLPALHALQHALGHLPEPALAAAAAHLRVPVSEVHGVATGYPEFRLTPRGRHHVRVCTGVTCALLGGRSLLDEIAGRHGAAPGALGAERPLTLEAADCFFACSMAPLVEVDEVLCGRADAGTVASLLAEHAGPTAAAATPSPGLPSRAPVRPAGADAPGADRTAGLVGNGPAGRALAALVAAARARAEGTPALRLSVQTGTCGRSVGGDRLLAALREAVAARGLGVGAVDGACAGACWAAPSVEIHRTGWPRALIERVRPEQIAGLLDTLGAPDRPFSAAGLDGVVFAEAPWRGLTPAARHPFWAVQERVLLARCGAIDADSLDDALRHGAYAALARALDEGPDAVIAAVKASGLQGRGGAFFPTATKWEACRRAAGEPKYLVVNGEEGEPGIFKDRHLMEGDPHQVLEGALIAAFAAGASGITLYVHGEAHRAAERLTRAVGAAEAAGILGDRVLGRPVACRAEVRRGAGGFVLGEETALLESIEGRRAQPRTRPPFPVESGLWGRPTVINNVETLSAIPAIVGHGGEWFAALGTAAAPGTKVFGLSGPIERPGVVETRQGVTLGQLLGAIGGGLRGGGRPLGAVVGGPSGSIVPAALFDAPMAPRGAVSPGTGGIVAVPEGASVAGIVKILLGFNAAESCGKCTPCREGAPRLLALVDELSDAAGREARLAELSALAEAIQLASLCGLGQAAPLSLLRALETFPAHFPSR